MNLREELQVGKAAVFASGGQAVIKAFKDMGDKIKIEFEDFVGDFSWFSDGSFLVKGLNHPMNIVALKEGEFQWSNVKPGMAFFEEDDEDNDEDDRTYYIYIGPSYIKDEEAIFEDLDQWGDAVRWERKQMKRFPQKDKN